jgi:hypothetical protein
MLKPNKLYLILIILLLVFNVQAQEEEIDNLLDIIVNQNNTKEDNTVLDIAQLQSELENIHRHPININSKEFEIFVRIGVVNMTQYTAIEQHISIYGSILAIEELQQIPHLDKELIRNLKPFISFTGISDLSDHFRVSILKESRKDLTIHYQQTLQKSNAYKGSDASYLGNPVRFLMKFSTNLYKRWRFGLNLEKDAGESFVWLPKQTKLGFDHVSGYLKYSGKGILNTLIIGDYQVSFAQGLSYWKGLSFGKSASTVPIRKIAQGIRPHTGLDEVNFLRGIGLKLGNNKIKNTTFLSFRSLDAIPIDSNLNAIQSILISGYHRTLLERNYASTLKEISWGNHFDYQFSNLNLGFSYTHQFLSSDLAPKKGLDKLQSFVGRENYVLGFDADLRLNNAHLFSEISRSANGGIAYLIGTVFTLDPSFSFSILHRNYTSTYQSISSSAFGESNLNQNEIGIYFGIELKLSHKTILNAYADLYAFPWIKHQLPTPSSGKDYLFKITRKSNKKLITSFQYRFEQDEAKIPLSNIVQNRYRHRIRLQNEHAINSSIKLRYRIELHFLKFIEKKRGYLFYTDLIIHSPEKPYSISVRYALFNTDDYSTRIYAYERDAYFTYSIKPYFYKGQKVYFLLKWRLKRFFTFVFRLSNTSYPFANSISSANNLIDGNNKTDLTFQLRIRW